MSLLAVATHAAEHAAEHEAWWRAYLEMVRSPAHYLGEFTIEIVGGIIGMHAVQRVAHRLVHGALRRLHSIGRRLTTSR